jgi:RNA polymerase sigma factor (sigma-70 family)
VSRDGRRLEELAEVHGPRVLGYLARRTNDPADAADVFQAVLVATWKRLSDVPDDDQGALAWLLGTARRCLANHRRGRTRRLQATERLRNSIRLATVDVENLAPGVTEAMMSLEEDDQEILTLVYWEDLTIEQAARVLEVTPVAARKRIERARTRLRNHLERLQSEPDREPA